MFEREVMMGSLKKINLNLSKLIEELEDKGLWDEQDLLYCQETLKSLETGLRKIRKMEMSSSFADCVW